MKLPIQTFISALLLVICLAMLFLIHIQKQQQASLQNGISRLSSENKQEATTTPSSTSSISDSTSSVKQPTFNPDRELKKIQRRNYSNNQKLMEDNQRINNNTTPTQDITLDELKEKHPNVYNHFIESLQTQWQRIAESHEAKVRLLESLNPDYLSPEDMGAFRKAIEEQKRNDEYALAFQRKPLPNGLYYGPHGEICSDGNRSDKDEIPPRIDVDNLILKYCANAVGLDYSFVKELNRINFCTHPQTVMRIMPYFMEDPIK